MKVIELAQKLGLKPLTALEGCSDVTGAYACDMLSRVMSGCKAKEAWITVQTHLNILAVAELNEAACIIIPEGISVEPATVQKAEERGISILSAEQGVYELCWKIHELLS